VGNFRAMHFACAVEDIREYFPSSLAIQRLRDGLGKIRPPATDCQCLWIKRHDEIRVPVIGLGAIEYCDDGGMLDAVLQVNFPFEVGTPLI
jgi:hypothetical protein